MEDIQIKHCKGYYRIFKRAEGTYKYTFSCLSYEPVEQSITVTAGIRSKADVTLVNFIKKVG